jgi:hypothetical protein
MNPYSSAHAPTDTVRQASDVLLVLDSADRGVSQSITGEVYANPITQPYNNFNLQKPQALVQGGIKRLKLTEVKFPYAIPNNVPTVTNFVWVQTYSRSTGAFIAEALITLSGFSTGFYSGTQYATELQTRLRASATIGVAAGNTWVVTYGTDSSFIITSDVTGTANLFTMTPIQKSTIGSVALPPKSLLSVLGFDVINNFNDVCVTPSDPKVSLYTPLSYTSYIDMTSVNLTRFQTIADTSTRQDSRGNLICRLFVADENSVVPTIGAYWDSSSNVSVTYNTATPAGSLPFVIHRQFQDPKVFRWENNASINAIDIQLYDDVGNLLFYPSSVAASYSVPNFQVSFKCSEE